MSTDQKIDVILDTLEEINATGSSLADWAAVSAVAVSVLAIWMGYITAKSQLEAERRRYTAQLHDLYWSDEIRDCRQIAMAAQQALEDATDKKSYLTKLRATGDNGRNSDEWKKISRLISFFSDLELYVQEKVVDEKLAMSMFGSAQYVWFQRLISALRAEIEADPDAMKNPPSWIVRTVSFEKRMKARKTKRCWCRKKLKTS